MILAALAVASLGTGAVYAYKHYGSAKVLAAVKAEVASVESEARATESKLSADAKAAYTAVAARIKALL